jgi:subtilisin family serine protease
MSKLLVVPHPAHLNALMATNAQAVQSTRAMVTTAGFAAGEEGAVTKQGKAPAGPIALRDLLDQRSEALSTFAALATTNAKGIAAMRGLSTRLAMAAEEPAPHQILPALGAIIMDEQTVDRRALEQTAFVFENVLIPLVPPHIEYRQARNGEWVPQTRQAAVVSSANAWHLGSINVAAARAKRLTGDGVLVGVLDTGIDAAHAELAGRLYAGSAFAEFDKTGAIINTNPHDPFQHGTHVCGLIAGRTVGVAPAASLAVASVLTYPTPQGAAGYLTQIASGLNWLLATQFRGATADPGFDVINASLGGTGYDPYLYTPLAQARLALGTIMIAAIGNSGMYGINKHGSPGDYDVTVGVGAVDQYAAIAPFSDWGTVPQHGGIAKPDICAPGVDVWSSIPGGNYMAMSGTSMATPIVTGAAALLLQDDSGLSLVAANLLKRLYALTATPPGGPKAGRGRLDLTNI